MALPEVQRHVIYSGLRRVEIEADLDGTKRLLWLVRGCGMELCRSNEEVEAQAMTGRVTEAVPSAKKAGKNY